MASSGKDGDRCGLSSWDGDRGRVCLQTSVRSISHVRPSTPSPPGPAPDPLPTPLHPFIRAHGNKPGHCLPLECLPSSAERTCSRQVPPHGSSVSVLPPHSQQRDTILMHCSFLTNLVEPPSHCIFKVSQTTSSTVVRWTPTIFLAGSSLRWGHNQPSIKQIIYELNKEFLSAYKKYDVSWNRIDRTKCTVLYVQVFNPIFRLYLSCTTEYFNSVAITLSGVLFSKVWNLWSHGLPWQYLSVWHHSAPGL